MLTKYPNGLTEKSLKDTEGYQAWVARIGTNPRAANNPSLKSDGEAPQESIETALTEIENNLSAELVKQIQDMSPEFLEKSVLKLLGAMGYGVDSDSLQHTGFFALQSFDLGNFFKNPLILLVDRSRQL